MKQKSVIAIEDNIPLLECYKYFISEFENYELIKGYTSVEEAYQDAKHISSVDIIISDISLPGVNGIKGIKMFKELYPKTKVLMISVNEETPTILKSINEYADGYLTKPINKDLLLESLNKLSKGEVPLSSVVTQKIIETLRPKKVEGFTERENEVIFLLSKGYSYNNIADELFISSSTVNYHLQNIYLKLDVKSKSEALKKISEILN